MSAPPPKFRCYIDYRCSADIKGQVSGAGIAMLQSLPGVPVGNANLMAPRGKVNAGAAGLRHGSYDPDAPVRIVGYGPVTETDTRALTKAEKTTLADQ